MSDAKRVLSVLELKEQVLRHKHKELVYEAKRLRLEAQQRDRMAKEIREQIAVLHERIGAGILLTSIEDED